MLFKNLKNYGIIIKYMKLYNLESEHKKMLLLFKKKTELKAKLNAERIRLLALPIQDENTKLKIKELTKNIDEIKVEEEQKQYFLKASKLLYDYYKKDNVDNTEKKESTGTIHDMIHVVKTSNKALILEKYMNNVNSQHETNIIEIDNNHNICECGVELTLKRSEGELVCMKCGKSNDYVIDSEKKSYKNVPPDITYFAYKRINHFNELIAQFQAKETTNIPVELYNDIKKELKKQRITDLSKLTPEDLRKILKKIKMTQYYDHIPHILHKLNGKPILTLSREMEHKLRSMFKDLQEPFVECCPDNRNNFLNYSYTFYKLFELLELDEFLDCFPKLISKEKRFNMDIIWKCICQKLKWQFIKSV